MIDTVVAGLAGARLTRAWLYETIGEPVREPIQTWAENNWTPDDDGNITVNPVKTFVEDLITCPHCIGFWFTLGCVLAYRWRLTRPVVVALAGATIMSAFADHYPGFAPEEPADG